VGVTEVSYAFYCGAIVAVSVVMQAATLMFEEVRRLPLWAAGIFWVTTFVFQQAHDYLGVSWRGLYVGSFFYFVLTLAVGEYFSRRRKRRHRAKMAEYERRFEHE
jgi:hypothetical protein